MRRPKTIRCANCRPKPSARTNGACRCVPTITGPACWVKPTSPRSKSLSRKTSMISARTACCWISQAGSMIRWCSSSAPGLATNVGQTARSTSSPMCRHAPCSAASLITTCKSSPIRHQSDSKQNSSINWAHRSCIAESCSRSQATERRSISSMASLTGKRWRTQQRLTNCCSKSTRRWRWMTKFPKKMRTSRIGTIPIP